MTYQSPISPGYSWYEDTAGPRPDYPALDGDRTVDVVIIGGGFTGLSAATHLAKAGTSVALIEAHRFGDGASGRNGGQLGTGQRAGAEELEAELGFDARQGAVRPRRGSQGASARIRRDQQDRHRLPARPSQRVATRSATLPNIVEHAEAMATRFGYPHITYMDAAETAERLGSDHYFGGVRDTGTGHIHPLKLVHRHGAGRGGGRRAALREHARRPASRPMAARSSSRRRAARSRRKKCLIAVNAYGGDLEPQSAAHVMPIGSFIGATVPLGDDSPVLPGGESVDRIRASSCAISASRRTGGCCSAAARSTRVNDPKDIHIHIRKQIAEIYPALKDVEITHGWGGYVGITMPRKPFVREVMPNVISAGGYSGHGVMLSNYRRQALRRDRGRQPRPAEAVRGAEDPGLSGRPALPRAAAVPGAQLVRAARPDLGDRSVRFDVPRIRGGSPGQLSRRAERGMRSIDSGRLEADRSCDSPPACRRCIDPALGRSCVQLSATSVRDAGSTEPLMRISSSATAVVARCDRAASLTETNSWNLTGIAVFLRRSANGAELSPSEDHLVAGLAAPPGTHCRSFAACEPA